MKKLLLPLLLCIVLKPTIAATSASFCWGNATVYFVITDRFCNGDTTNDINYGRLVDYGSEQLNAATFHGGDFKSLRHIAPLRLCVEKRNAFLPPLLAYRQR